MNEYAGVLAVNEIDTIAFVLPPLLKEFHRDDRLAYESHLAKLETPNNINHAPRQIDNPNGIGWRCDHAVGPAMGV